MPIIKMFHSNRNLTIAETIARYVTNLKKSPNRLGGAIILENDAVKSITNIAQQFGEDKDICLEHFVITFRPEESVDPAEANKIGDEIITFIWYTCQTFYSVHEDMTDLHIHLLIDPISFLDGYRFCKTNEEFDHFLMTLGGILGKNHGLQTFWDTWSR